MILDLLTDFQKWERYEHFLFNRIIEGIISVCLSNRVFPVIKTVKGSEICSMIAQKVNDFFHNNIDFVKKECGRELNGMLLICDRKEDPITPLLNQWTYQAMIHELIGIKNNIIEIKHDSTRSDKFVVADHEDKFFSNNLANDFGDVASKVKELVEELNKEQANLDKKLDSIEDIKKLVDKLPEKKKESAEITKHTNIIYELTEIMQSRQLLELSSLEQDIACNDNRSAHSSKLSSILKNPKINSLDKGKLFMLYCLRYEGDSSINNLRNILVENNLNEWSEYADYLLIYAGKNKRTLDVFNNKDFILKNTNKLMQAFKSIPNVFTQHSSYIPSILERIIKGKENMKDIETTALPGFKER